MWGVRDKSDTVTECCARQSSVGVEDSMEEDVFKFPSLQNVYASWTPSISPQQVKTEEKEEGIEPGNALLPNAITVELVKRGGRLNVLLNGKQVNPNVDNNTFPEMRLPPCSRVATKDGNKHTTSPVLLSFRAEDGQTLPSCVVVKLNVTSPEPPYTKTTVATKELPLTTHASQTQACVAMPYPCTFVAPPALGIAKEPLENVESRIVKVYEVIRQPKSVLRRLFNALGDEAKNVTFDTFEDLNKRLEKLVAWLDKHLEKQWKKGSDNSAKIDLENLGQPEFDLLSVVLKAMQKAMQKARNNVSTGDNLNEYAETIGLDLTLLTPWKPQGNEKKTEYVSFLEVVVDSEPALVFNSNKDRYPVAAGMVQAGVFDDVMAFKTTVKKVIQKSQLFVNNVNSDNELFTYFSTFELKTEDMKKQLNAENVFGNFIWPPLEYKLDTIMELSNEQVSPSHLVVWNPRVVTLESPHRYTFHSLDQLDDDGFVKNALTLTGTLSSKVDMLCIRPNAQNVGGWDFSRQFYRILEPVLKDDKSPKFNKLFTEKVKSQGAYLRFGAAMTCLPPALQTRLSERSRANNDRVAASLASGAPSGDARLLAQWTGLRTRSGASFDAFDAANALAMFAECAVCHALTKPPPLADAFTSSFEAAAEHVLGGATLHNAWKTAVSAVFTSDLEPCETRFESGSGLHPCFSSLLPYGLFADLVRLYSEADSRDRPDGKAIVQAASRVASASKLGVSKLPFSFLHTMWDVDNPSLSFRQRRLGNRTAKKTLFDELQAKSGVHCLALDSLLCLRRAFLALGAVVESMGLPSRVSDVVSADLVCGRPVLLLFTAQADGSFAELSQMETASDEEAKRLAQRPVRLGAPSPRVAAESLAPFYSSCRMDKVLAFSKEPFSLDWQADRMTRAFGDLRVSEDLNATFEVPPGAAMLIGTPAPRPLPSDLSQSAVFEDSHVWISRLRAAPGAVSCTNKKPINGKNKAIVCVEWTSDAPRKDGTASLPCQLSVSSKKDAEAEAEAAIQVNLMLHDCPLELPPPATASSAEAVPAAKAVPANKAPPMSVSSRLQSLRKQVETGEASLRQGLTHPVQSACAFNVDRILNALLLVASAAACSAKEGAPRVDTVYLQQREGGAFPADRVARVTSCAIVALALARQLVDQEDLPSTLYVYDDDDADDGSGGGKTSECTAVKGAVEEAASKLAEKYVSMPLSEAVAALVVPMSFANNRNTSLV